MKPILNWREKYKAWFAPITFMVAGIVTRFYVIAHAGSWWFDESFSYSAARLPIFSAWSVLRYENNPPFYYWFLRLWGLVFGFHEFSLRMFSVLLGVLTMLAIIWLASEIFSFAVGMWSGAIYAVTSLAIYSDTEARMYSLLALLIALSYIYFFKILFKKPSRIDVALYIIIATLALYTSITALWIPITQVVIMLCIKPKATGRLRVAIYIVLPIILFLPWLIPFIIEHIALSKYISADTWRYFSNGIAWSVPLAEPMSFFNFLSFVVPVAGSLALLAGVIFFVWFLSHVWKRRHPFESKLLLVALGLGVPLIISMITIDLGAARYYYQSAIFFWIAMAYAIESLFERTNAKFLRGIIVFMVACYAIFNIEFSVAYAVHGNWNLAASWIEDQHPDLVLAMPKMWDAEIYDSSDTFYFLPPPIPALQSLHLDPFQTVTRYNYNWGALSYYVTPQQAMVLRGEVAQATASSSRIVFGYQGSQGEQIILTDLADLGFKADATFDVDGYLPEKLTVFDRNLK